jgi:hypothetical protein
MPRKLTQEEIDARRQAVEGTWITIQTLKEESETLKNKRKVIAAQIKEQERNQVEKAQGLKKGEHVTRLGKICIVDARWEPLNAIDQADVVREGFEDITPEQFVEMFCKHNHCDPDMDIRRIEFEYL